MTNGDSFDQRNQIQLRERGSRGVRVIPGTETSGSLQFCNESRGSFVCLKTGSGRKNDVIGMIKLFGCSDFFFSRTPLIILMPIEYNDRVTGSLLKKKKVRRIKLDFAKIKSEIL